MKHFVPTNEIYLREMRITTMFIIPTMNHYTSHFAAINQSITLSTKQSSAALC